MDSMEVEEDAYENRARTKVLSIKNSNGCHRASYISQYIGTPNT